MAEVIEPEDWKQKNPKIAALIEYLKGSSLIVKNVVGPKGSRDRAWTFQVASGDRVVRVDVDEDFVDDWKPDEITKALERSTLPEKLAFVGRGTVFVDNKGRVHIVR